MENKSKKDIDYELFQMKSLINSTALVALLVEKKIFSFEEYNAAIKKYEDAVIATLTKAAEENASSNKSG